MNSRSLLLCLGKASEEVYALFVFNDRLVAATLKREVECRERVVLSVEQSLAGYGNTHRDGYGDLVVSDLDLTYFVEYAEFVLDAGVKVLAVKEQNVLT